MTIRTPTARLLVMVLLMIAQAAHVHGQTVNHPAPGSSQDSLQMDFSLLRNKLQHDYPSLYRYTNKATMNALLDSCFATIQNTTTPLDFFRMLKFVVSQIKDGHLSCSPSRELRQYLGEQKAYFPYRLRFINNKAYIYNGADTGLPPATEILAVNNKPINQIKNKLFQYIVSDGHIETKKNYILGNYFYIYYFLGIGPQSHFDITYKTANGSTGTKRVAAVLEKELPPIEGNSPQNKLLNLAVTPDHIAILTIQTFDKDALGEAGLDFEEFCRTAFSSIKDQQIKKLVIDLRGNGGGRDGYGSLLYSYLSREKFHYYKSLIAATDQLPYDQFGRTTSSYNGVTPALLEKTTTGSYQLKPAAHDNLQVISPADNNYTYEVWFLENGLSYSVTAEFCAIARSNKRGKFIGEESGGGHEGNTSGPQIDVVLPASQITVSFGTIQYNMAIRPGKHPGRGIIPDYPVLPTIKDLLNKRDTQLERAMKLVRGRIQGQ